ncbi:contractile injection system tape measure protein [Aquimarina sp. M1]
MSHLSHIINKQIIEIEVSDQTTTLSTQQKISQLHTSQLLPMLGRMFDVHFGADDTHYQIDRLTIDLGQVALASIPKVFDKELANALTSIRGTSQISVTKTVPITPSDITEERTPFRVVAHYLDTGRLPWWSATQKKSYLQEQWELLMQNPTQNFKKLLSQLHLNDTHLDRYLHVFSEEQVLQTAQWITGVSEKELYILKNKVEEEVHKIGKHNRSSLWKTAFLRIIYSPKSAQETKSEHYYIQKTLQALGIKSNSNSNTPQYKLLQKIQSLLEKYQQIAPHHQMLKEVTKQCKKLLQTSAIHSVPVNLLRKIAVVLEGLQEEIKTSGPHFSAQTVSSKLWVSLTTHINTLDKIVQQTKPKNDTIPITKLQSQFEDTDFITIDNAGLVLFWPFLPRFFENLGLLADKNFVDESAKHKAICALQYLCNPDESELFEGSLSLPKILCGVPLTEPVPPILLTEEEKQIADGLLKAVMQQGPYWKNLSITGFRTSYLCRQASFRTRDDHWLLQVQKETYDITLQKLQWSIQAVKLPWMERALMVEWL